MASYDPEFDQAPKFSPEYDDSRPRQRGCFFYGCVIASVLTVLLIIALAVLAFIVMRFFYRFRRRMDLARTDGVAQGPDFRGRAQVGAGAGRRFQEGSGRRNGGRSPGLTSDDLNALIEENPDFRGRIFARVEGDKLKAQISFPLDKLKIGHAQGTLPQRRGRAQSLAERRHAGRDPGFARGQRQAARRRSSWRSCASRIWPRMLTRTPRTPR